MTNPLDGWEINRDGKYPGNPDDEVVVVFRYELGNLLRGRVDTGRDRGRAKIFRWDFIEKGSDIILYRTTLVRKPKVKRWVNLYTDSGHEDYCDIYGWWYGSLEEAERAADKDRLLTIVEIEVDEDKL